MGRPRIIHPGMGKAMKIHHSVKLKMEHSDYKPKMKLESLEITWME